MASTQLKTPVQSHPLLPEENTSTRGRRARGAQSNSSDVKPKADYFALKAQSEHDATTTRPVNWDGSVRGYSRLQSAIAPLGLPNDRRTEDHDIFDLSTSPNSTTPHLAVGSPNSSLFGTSVPTPHFLITDEDDGATLSRNHVVSTKWHNLSGEGMERAITTLGKSSTFTTDIETYQSALRTLSSAYHDLCQAQLELEEKRKELAEKNIARKKRADELLKEIRPSEQEIAKRVLQSLFTDDDEEGHRVERNQSSVVR